MPFGRVPKRTAGSGTIVSAAVAVAGASAFTVGDAMAGTEYDRDVIWRLTDQTYRQARGYQVHNKWLEFRSKKDLTKYEKEDLKETY